MTTMSTNMAGTRDVALLDEHAVTVWGRASWGPILMGAACAIATQFTFTVLGIALGATAGEVTAGVDGQEVRTMGLAAGLWWLITGTIAIAVGALVLGRVSGLPRSAALTLQAASMWGVVAIFGFLVVWSGAGMLSQAASPLGTLVSASHDPYASRPDAANALQEGAAGATQSLSESQRTAWLASRDDALRATQAAAWWAVIGMIIGLVVSVLAASAAVPARLRTNTNHT